MTYIVKGKCVEKPMKALPFKKLDNDLIQKTECDKALERLEGYLFSENKVRLSQEFKEIMKDVLNSCSCISPIDSAKEDIDPPIRVKSLDMVARHAKIYPHQGKLPSGHRGDLLKVRNGHGFYVPLEDRLH